MANMRYVLLTWNPGPEDDEQYTPEQWLDEMVLPLQEGRPPGGDRWSIGTNWKVIEAGDMACMFRQGAHGRGIVATGVITRGAFRGPHWNPDKTGEAWYVNVAWNRALDLNQMITIDELAREVPGFGWNKVYGSGRIVDGSPAGHLASLLGQGPLPPKAQEKGGQQFGTAEHNRLVELEAMELVSAGYKAERYIVRDVSKENLGWDLEARRGGKVAYIEVKGATGPLPEFFLTPNEHRAASDQEGWVAVVITEIFGAEPAWYEFSGREVTTAAKPTQFRVTPGP
jgi:hypothetical protein